MLEQQLELSKINTWANKRIRDSLKESFTFDELQSITTPYGTLAELIFHVFGAVSLWLKRLGISVEGFKRINQIASIDELFSLWEAVDNKYNEFIEQLNQNNTSPNYLFKYKNAKGEDLEIPVNEMVFQLHNHSYYHRGQIAYVVRANNKNPLPGTDSIIYYRENKKKN